MPPAPARTWRKKMGFIGGKMPLHHGPAEGEEGLRKTSKIWDMREKVGDGLLADARLLDVLDLNYATKLATALTNSA
jgi:L-rhamnonate dehydratase